MRIKYRNSALEDVRGIREYISRDSSSIALKFINKLLDYIWPLVTFFVGTCSKVLPYNLDTGGYNESNLQKKKMPHIQVFVKQTFFRK